MSIKFKFAVPVLSIVLGAAAIPAFAQQDNGGGGAANNNGGGGGGGGGGGQNGGGGGGRGNWQQMMQRRMDRIKGEMGVTDDEWSAIEPKIQAVTTAQRDVMVGMFGGRGRGPGGNQGGGAGGNAPQSDLAKAMADLQTTLDQKDATPDDIKGKLEAVRTARKAARDTLSKAQDDLKSVLTQRQEAVLVENGMLE